MTTNTLPAGSNAGAITSSLAGYDVTILQSGVSSLGGWVIVYSNRSLKGEGQTASTMSNGGVAFDVNCQYGSVEYCGVDGHPSYYNMWVQSGGFACSARDFDGLLGSYNLEQQGTECHFENCYFGNPQSGIVVESAGSARYFRCKLDTQQFLGGYTRPNPCYGFVQRTSINGQPQDNRLMQVDLSGGDNGGYTQAFWVDDGYAQARTIFTGSILGSDCFMYSHAWTCFTGCEFGGDVYNHYGYPATAVGNVGVISTKTGYGSGWQKGGNRLFV